MNSTNRPPEKVFLTTARCTDCSNPACVQACPEHIDLRALFDFVAAQAPMPLAWMRKVDEAETYAGEAIHNSFN